MENLHLRAIGEVEFRIVAEASDGSALDTQQCSRFMFKLGPTDESQRTGIISQPSFDNRKVTAAISLTDDFISKVLKKEKWNLVNRTNNKVHKTVDANDLWEQMNYAAWSCADPGIQFDTTINDWHTCPNSGRINASNPCSEYMFLDNTACNLASINLIKFLTDGGEFDIPQSGIELDDLYIPQKEKETKYIDGDTDAIVSELIKVLKEDVKAI